MRVSKNSRVLLWTHNFASIEDHDFVRIHDSLETMSNREEGDILAELSAQRRLDDRVSLIV